MKPKISTNPQKVLSRERQREAPQHHFSKTCNLKLPRLHWSNLVLATQYLISQTPNNFHDTYDTVCEVVHLAALQRQMERIHLERYDIRFFIKKGAPTHQITTRQNTSTPSKPLTKVVNYEPHFIDPEYQRDFYWD